MILAHFDNEEDDIGYLAAYRLDGGRGGAGAPGTQTQE